MGWMRNSSTPCGNSLASELVAAIAAIELRHDITSHDRPQILLLAESLRTMLARRAWRFRREFRGQPVLTSRR